MRREITVSAYVMTDDPMQAHRAAEALGRVLTGLALDGGVDTALRVGTTMADDENDPTGS